MRRALARAVSRYAKRCWGQEMLVILGVYQKALAYYDAHSSQPTLSECTRVCDPLQDPNWGLVAYDYDRSRSVACYRGCDGELASGFDSMVWFIHRQVLRGVSAAEQRELLKVVLEESSSDP